MDGARKDRRHYALLSVRNLNANGRVRCRAYCGGGFCKIFWFKIGKKIKKNRMLSNHFLGIRTKVLNKFLMTKVLICIYSAFFVLNTAEILSFSVKSKIDLF